ncbi:uncharacterized protein LOC109852077 [Pseudomyrmex gracilis]|uniref:uncharacterized protein LOC109852077 n=1 Tax=Pseudomyrmex gracilis TaxID=219809 RepID=UPI000994A932|nr:uncharacterized protein LOC109852077 [Pseudomyrmex gracilis]
MRKSTSGSSILKPQKPRQPLQVVNFDSSPDENNPPTKLKRRVSFAEKKHVKEFCHTTEQGTVWDSTYEEHDCSSKGSLDQNFAEESIKKLEYISTSTKNIAVESNVNCSNNSCLENNGPSEPVMRTNEENDMTIDMDCTSPVIRTKLLDNCSQIENIPLLASSTLSNDNEAHNVTDEMSQQEIYTSSSARATSDVSKNAVSSNIFVYRDPDEEDCVSNRANKTCLQNDSMELTTAIPVSLMVLRTEEQNIIQNDDKMHSNDSHTNCTTNFNNVSMEITQAVPTFKPFINCDSNIFEHSNKKVSETPIKKAKTCESATYNVGNNNVHNDAIFGTESRTTYINDSMVLTTVIPTNADLICTNDPNLNMSMDITTAVSGKILGGTAPHLCSESTVAGRDQIERTNYFTDVPMDMTEPVNTLSSNVCDKENLRSHGAISSNDRTMFFHNVSMEITKPVLSRNYQEVSANPITRKLTRGDNVQGEEVAGNSTCWNKDTRFLNEPMELTEVVPNVLYNERTLDATRAPLVSDTMQKNTPFPAKHIAHPIDYVPPNKVLIQSASHHSTDDATSNKLENLIIPENKCLVTIDRIQSPEASPTVQSTIPDLTKSTCHINTDASQIQDVSMEITAPLPVTSHLTRDVTLNEVEDENKRLQQSMTKNPARESVTQEDQVLMETISQQTKTTHNKSSNISIVASDNSDRSDKNSCETNDDNSVEFQYFQENNAREASIADDNQRFVDTADRAKTNLKDSLNGSNECSFLRKSLPYLENSDLQSINPPSLMNSEEETSFPDASVNHHRFQASTSDSQVNNKHESSEQLVTNETTVSEHPTESRKSVAKDNESFAVLRDKKESANVENGETKDRHGNVEETSKIEDNEVNIRTIAKANFIDSQCGESTLDTTDVQNKQISISPINVTKDNVKSQGSMEHVQDRVEENLPAEKSVVTPAKEKPLTEEDHFLLLSQKLETHGERDDCIWNVFRKNVDKKFIAFGFMANSLLIVAVLFGNLTRFENNHPHKRIKIISRLTDKADVLIRIVHKLLLRKVDVEMLERHENIFSMLDFMSQEVKLAMDFMFDLRRLNDSNMMEIACDKISFVSLSKHVNIILRITIEVKVFDELTPNDINVHCVLGAVRETEVKNLMKNIKKDSKFLRRYMNDVQNYIDIMENV